MTFLWTDYFIYFLIILIIVYLLKVSNKPLLMAKWERLFSRPINVFSAIILFVYFSIAVLDSIHWVESNTENRLNPSGVISALDVLLYPLASHTERSYSAPFAIYGASKELIETSQEEEKPEITHSDPRSSVKSTRDYPRLTYAGKHLKKVEDRDQDILRRVIYAALGGTIITLTLSVIILMYARIGTGKTWEVYFEEVCFGKMNFPWRTFLMTLWGLICLGVFLTIVMPYYHPFGTDQIGGDVLYATLKSVRTGVVIGTLTTFVTLPFAIFFGVMAGYFKGWTDDVIQYVYTTLSAIPGVLLIAAAVLVMQILMDQHMDLFESTIQRGDLRLLLLCIILGITGWAGLCRLLRAETLKLSEYEFIQAAKVLGVSHYKIIVKHFIPNLMHLILITFVLDFSGLVLAEAVLSYVGVGVDPTTYSWGMMINSARLEFARVPVVWWSLTAAFVFMFFLVLAANIFSDAVRDLFDPHHVKG